MNTIKNISFFLMMSVVLNVLSKYLESNFLLDFLCANLIIILLTLLAINTATTGLLSIKMAELTTKFKELNFDATYKEMKFSLKEQIFLICLSIIILIINGSKILLFEYKDLIVCTLLTTVFLYAIDILRDTGVSVFDLLELSNKFEKK
ncbi:hypothetical protein [Flavobacterium sp.]|uniref:hypothetical protein n=1 Tax=Flavobacterium sp. TaxID=239 RepID=UPI0037505C95